MDKSDGNSRSRISASKRWVFTRNNYKENEMAQWIKVFEGFDMKYIIGKEVGENGTPHLQGYVEAAKKFRPIEKFRGLQAHWEKARGNIKKNHVYCSKDGDFATNIILPRELEKIEKSDLRKDQLDIAEQFLKPEHKFGRKIFWYWEHEGNWGKTVLATYMVDHMGAIVVGGKAKDAAYAIQMYIEKNKKGPEIVIMDVPRTRSAEYISYETIEIIKNGIFFSGKFKGGMVRFNRPHFIVFANEPPETHRMSMDRWVITELPHAGGY